MFKKQSDRDQPSRTYLAASGLHGDSDTRLPISVKVRVLCLFTQQNAGRYSDR